MSKNNKSKPELDVVPSEAITQAPAPVAATEPLVGFDGWYALRSPKIPPQHHKEIIKADMRARKVPMTSSMSTFDAALAKYGVKLA